MIEDVITKALTTFMEDMGHAPEDFHDGSDLFQFAFQYREEFLPNLFHAMKQRKSDDAWLKSVRDAWPKGESK